MVGSRRLCCRLRQKSSGPWHAIFVHVDNTATVREDADECRTPMSTPLAPKSIAIARPKPGFNEALDRSLASSPVGTPALRAAQFGTPPVVPNIPPRGAATPTPRTGTPAFLPASPGSSPRQGRLHRPEALEAAAPDSDEPNEEDKIRVLRRHLVSKAERLNDRDGDASCNQDLDVRPSGSAQGSSAAQSIRRVPREDTEPFPIPYDTPGADIT